MTEEIPTHLIAVMFVVVVAVFVPGFLVMEHLSNAAIDTSLADQAVKIAAAANTLSGEVPDRTKLEILPGSVEFIGIKSNNSILANVNCNVTLTPGTYNVNLKYVQDNVTCAVVRQR